jgi:hypothetical protein
MNGSKQQRAATRAVLVAATGALALSAFAACGDDKTSGADSTGDESAASNDLPQGGAPFDIDPADFSADITNPYFPMKPGRRWTYREVEPDGTVQEVVMIATSDTKKLANGVTARVVRDTVTLDGAIIEDTLDWYAQDSKGNVWYMGEDTAEFEDGTITSREGAWEAGVDGALPGIAMPANPTEGMTYRQEYYKGHAEDRAEVLSNDEMVESEYGQFDNAVLTKDLVPLEPDVEELKFYVKDVGMVLALKVSGGSGREALVSVDEAPEGAGTGPLGDPNP